MCSVVTLAAGVGLGSPSAQADALPEREILSETLSSCDKRSRVEEFEAQAGQGQCKLMVGITFSVTFWPGHVGLVYSPPPLLILHHSGVNHSPAGEIIYHPCLEAPLIG